MRIGPPKAFTVGSYGRLYHAEDMRFEEPLYAKQDHTHSVPVSVPLGLLGHPVVGELGDFTCENQTKFKDTL